MTTDYGSDLSCTYRTQTIEMEDGSFVTYSGVDLALNMAEVSGRACLAEALVRRIVTPRGTLLDVVVPTTTGNYGYDLTGLVNADLSTRDLAMIGANVDAEYRKDERVVSSQTTVTVVGSGANKLIMVASVVTDGTGPFPLVLGISQVSVQILSVPQ